MLGGGHFRGFLELRVQPIRRRFAVAAVHPIDETQRPQVLAAQRVLVGQARLFDGLQREFGNVEGDQLIPVERSVLQRVGVVPGLAQIAFAETAGVGDDDAAGLEAGQFDLQRRRVHGDQHVEGIARRLDDARSEIDLERRDAEQGAGGCADFGGEVGEGRQFVSGEGGRQGELAARQLHTVAGITCKAYGDGLEFKRLSGCGHSLYPAARNEAA